MKFEKTCKYKLQKYDFLRFVPQQGFTLVVSPLVSLMEDQVIALRKLKINAAMLSATSSKTENNEVLSNMTVQSSDLKILYVTPERLAKSKRFMNKLEKVISEVLMKCMIVSVNKTLRINIRHLFSKLKILKNQLSTKKTLY